MNKHGRRFAIGSVTGGKEFKRSTWRILDSKSDRNPSREIGKKSPVGPRSTSVVQHPSYSVDAGRSTKSARVSRSPMYCCSFKATAATSAVAAATIRRGAISTRVLS